jgi:hypothetical protein
MEFPSSDQPDRGAEPGEETDEKSSRVQRKHHLVPPSKVSVANHNTGHPICHRRQRATKPPHRRITAGKSCANCEANYSRFPHTHWLDRCSARVIWDSYRDPATPRSRSGRGASTTVGRWAKPASPRGMPRAGSPDATGLYRYGDSNPGFRTEKLRVRLGASRPVWVIDARPPKPSIPVRHRFGLYRGVRLPLPCHPRRRRGTLRPPPRRPSGGRRCAG